MTNDNAPAKPIQERFATALGELIGMCADAGMNPSEMIRPLKAALLQVRMEAMPTDADDRHNAKAGLPPISEEAMRQQLELEPYEPIPPRRTDNV